MTLGDLFEDDEFSCFRHKAASNAVLHGVTFDEARLVFSDYLLVELGEDLLADYGDQRFNVIGRSGEKLLFVTHALRGELVHINISEGGGET